MKLNKKPLTRSQLIKQRRHQRQKQKLITVVTWLTIISNIINIAYTLLKLLGLAK